MVSRFGDCGITTDTTAKSGYSIRISPEELEPIEGLCYTLIKCNCFFCRTYGFSVCGRTWEIHKEVKIHRPDKVINPTRTKEGAK